MQIEPITSSTMERAFSDAMLEYERDLKRYTDDVARTVRMEADKQRIENTRAKMREIFSDPKMAKMLADALTASDSTDEPAEEYRAEYPSPEDRAYSTRLRARFLSRDY